MSSACRRETNYPWQRILNREGREIPMDTSEMVPVLVCSTCGSRPAPDDEPTARLTWSLSIEDERPRWACERCSRENLRSIESKLDPAWW
jgi:hypothetical protein